MLNVTASANVRPSLARPTPASRMLFRARRLWKPHGSCIVTSCIAVACAALSTVPCSTCAVSAGRIRALHRSCPSATALRLFFHFSKALVVFIPFINCWNRRVASNHPGLCSVWWRRGAGTQLDGNSLNPVCRVEPIIPLKAIKRVREAQYLQRLCRHSRALPLTLTARSRGGGAERSDVGSASGHPAIHTPIPQPLRLLP